MTPRGRFVPITRKINSIILAGLIAGIGSITLYFSRDISTTIERSTREALGLQGRILFTAVENFMLPGEAPLAVEFFRDVGGVTPGFSVALFRVTGRPAFSDNITITAVNRNLGRERFTPREKNGVVFPQIVIQEGITSALGSPPRDAFFSISEDGRILAVVYKPLVNLPKCTGCHGSNHTIRGLLDIRTDITASVARQKTVLLVAGGFFFAVVAVVWLFLGRFIQAAVIVPVKKIGSVCEDVTAGKFSGRVAIENRDEIGRLAETVNAMVEGLHERFKLTKFVSASTIRSLKDEERTRKSRLTIFFSDIRGFTSFSEKNPPEEVVRLLNSVLNMQTDLVHANGGDVDKYVGDSVVAVWAGEDAEAKACETAVSIQKNLAADPAAFGGLTVGIGVTAGEVILGMIGSHRRADYTVIGDTVNTASRLCGVAKSGQIIVSDQVYGRIGPGAETEGPFKLKVKGKEVYLKVYILKAFRGV